MKIASARRSRSANSLAHLAENAHAQTRARERVAIHHLARQAELDAERAHLVLEQLAQRLDQLQVHRLRQAADVVVGLDDVRLAGARAGRLDDVRVDRALRQEAARRASLLRLLSNTSTNMRPMILRLASGSVTPASAARKRASASTRITRTPRCSREGAHDLVALAQAQQAVIDEHAHQLIADRAMQQRRHHRGIDAARQAQQHLAAADLGAHARDGILDDVAGAPQRVAAADLAHEALQQPRALRGVRDLGMELHTVEAPPLVRHGGERDGAGRWPSTAKPWRQGVDPVAVAHPHVEHGAAAGVATVLQVIEQAASRRSPSLRRSRTRARVERATRPPSCCAMVCMP